MRLAERREVEGMLLQKHIRRTAFILSLFFPVVCFGTETNQQIGAITIEGGKAFTDEELLRIAGIKPKQTYKPDTNEWITRRIKGAYLERGFIKAEVSVSTDSSIPQSSGKKEIINLKITVSEGPAYHVRRTEVIGNETTNHKVVMRAAGLWPEEPYNPNRIDRWVEGLNRLGRFETVKREDIEIGVNDQEHFADVLFHLKERPGLRIRRH
jgi:outer membrane protein insertion porin family